MVHSSNRRWHHHAALAAVTAVIYILISTVVASPTPLDQLSLASAYICLFLMAAALSIGPLQAIRTQRVSTNIFLRRDIGIWAALAGLIHLVVATAQSMTPRYMSLYVDVSTHKLSAALRAELFLWGSVSAFSVGLLLLLLLGLSNNFAMQYLGVTWWKRLQRSACLAFMLTLVHALMFQIIESRSVSMMALLLCLLLLLSGLQLWGFIQVTSRRKQKTGLQHAASEHKY